MQIKLRKILAVLSAIALLCTAIPFAALTVFAEDVEYLTNGGFENGTEGWTLKSGSSITTATVHDGSNAMTTANTGTKYQGIGQTAAIPVNQNTDYTLTFWYYYDGSNADPSFYTYVFEGTATTQIKVVTTHVAAPRTWAQGTLSFNTGDNTEVVILLQNRTANDGGTYYFDDFSLMGPEYSGVIVAPVGDNLLTNGSFEQGTLNDMPTGWNAYATAYQAIGVTTDAYEGDRCAHLAWRNQRFVLYQDVTVEPNTDYAATFWYRSLVTSSSAGTTVNYNFAAYTPGGKGPGDGTTVLIDEAAPAVVTDYHKGSWTKVTYNFNSGSATTVRLGFSATSSSSSLVATECNVLVDDMSLYKLETIGGEEPEQPDPYVPVEGNLFPNPSFEDGTVTGWNLSWFGTTLGTVAHSGGYSIALKNNGDYNGAGGYTLSGLTIGATYDFSFWYKSDGKLWLNATLKAEDGTAQCGTMYCNRANTEWTQITTSFTATDDVVKLAFSGAGSGTSDPSIAGTLYADDFVLLQQPSVVEPSFDGYLYDGDFETASADYWTISGGEIVQFEGDYALKGTIGDRYKTVAEQTITVEANTDYAVAISSKYVGPLTGGIARLHVYAGSTDLTASNYYWNIAANVWDNHILTFNSGSATQVRLVLQYHAAPNSSTAMDGNIYYDDIVVTKNLPGYNGTHPQEMTTGADIRFMTYNVLADKAPEVNGFDWGGAPVSERGPLVEAMINFYKPDVICLQEFGGNWYNYFQENLPNYAFGEMQSADTLNSGKLFTCIAYNTETVRLLDTALYRMQTYRWGTQGMRYVNVAFLEVIATGEKFIAANSHPDAGSLTGDQDLNNDGVASEGDGYWRQFQLEEAAEFVAGLSAEHQQPVIWGGDFNSSGTEDATYGKVTAAGFTDATAGRYIDHIFYNNMATHLYETTVSDADLSGASDHQPVFADIQFLDEYSTPISAVKNNIKTQGRTYMKNGAMMLDFSASGIEFSANCEGKVALQLAVDSIKNTNTTYGGIYFTVIVDGVKKDRAQCRITSTGSVELVLAEDLPAGNHTFEVYRQTEHRGAEVGISAITMNGTLNEKPADNRLYIEFIGDSISTGYGALGVAGDDQADSPLWQDATVAYPYLTAKALNADFSDVCYSGLGCKYGYSGSLSMQDVYPAQRYQYDRNTQYNFSTRQPDVVVIALATNDIANQTDAALRKVGYQEMLDLVRAKNPDAKIVWIYGMMKDDDNTMIANLMEENGGAAAGLYSLELTTNTAGAGWHPSAAAQQVFADELVAFLNSDVLVKYVGDEILDNDEGDILSLNGTSRMEMTADELGLAFRFMIEADGIEVINKTEAVLDNATVDVFGNGTQYKLVKMGALVTNKASIGMSADKMERGTEGVADVNATYLCDLEPDSAQFAVRITNIPLGYEDAIIYARAYYVFEYEGREVVVYDDIVSANYVDKYDSNDGVLEW